MAMQTATTGDQITRNGDGADPFARLMRMVRTWSDATDALSAVGAGLAVTGTGTPVADDLRSCLRAVGLAAGLGDLDGLSPEQTAIALGRIRLCVAEAADLLDDPARAAGWRHTHPDIVEGWGRGSMAVPAMIAAADERLAGVPRFLDVGTGAGWLAIAATRVWPDVSVVGIDNWETSLERARAHVADAALGDRITLRHQDVRDVDDVDAFDCVWVPTFFLTESVLDVALGRLSRTLAPGGWFVLGRFRAAPDPLTAATMALRTVRNGGCDLPAEALTDRLRDLGCVEVRAVPGPPAMPLDLVIGRRPR